MHFKKRIFFPILILITIFFFTCKSDIDCLKSTGNNIIKNQKVKPFKSITLMDNIDLEIYNMADSIVKIKAGENLINKIKIENLGDELIISNGNTCNWVRDLSHAVTVKIGINQNLLSINHKGYGKIISIDTIHIPYLLIGSFESGGNFDLKINNNFISIYTNSHALINIEGKSEELNLRNDGIGRITAEKLKAKKINAKNDGSNEVRVFPIEKLIATITQNGNILYYNEPKELIKSISGSGNLIKEF